MATGKQLAAGERLELTEVQAANFKMLTFSAGATVDVLKSEWRLP